MYRYTVTLNIECDKEIDAEETYKNIKETIVETNKLNILRTKGKIEKGNKAVEWEVKELEQMTNKKYLEKEKITLLLLQYNIENNKEYKNLTCGFIIQTKELIRKRLLEIKEELGE